MPALRRRLAAGEEVVLDVRPHWSTLAAPVAVLVAVIAGAVTVLVDGVASWVDWPVLAVLVLSALWLLRRYLTWATSRLVLTTARIVERRGVLARFSREIPLTAVTEVGVRRTIVQRLIGTGTLTIESAGRDGAEVFPALPRPALLRDEIYEQVSRAVGPAPAPDGYRTGWERSIPEQIDQLDQLRRRGALTAEEFERKKTELLDRL